MTKKNTPDDLNRRIGHSTVLAVGVAGLAIVASTCFRGEDVPERPPAQPKITHVDTPMDETPPPAAKSESEDGPARRPEVKAPEAKAPKSNRKLATRPPQGKKIDAVQTIYPLHTETAYGQTVFHYEPNDVTARHLRPLELTVHSARYSPAYISHRPHTHPGLSPQVNPQHPFNQNTGQPWNRNTGPSGVGLPGHTIPGQGQDPFNLSGNSHAQNMDLVFAPSFTEDHAASIHGHTSKPCIVLGGTIFNNRGRVQIATVNVILNSNEDMAVFDRFCAYLVATPNSPFNKVKTSSHTNRAIEDALKRYRDDKGIRYLERLAPAP